MTDAVCPQCQHAFRVNPTAHIPDDQTFSIELKGDSELFDARSLGGMITDTAKLMQSLAKEAGTPVVVFVAGIEMQPQSLKIRFVIAAVKKKGDSDR